MNNRFDNVMQGQDSARTRIGGPSVIRNVPRPQLPGLSRRAESANLEATARHQFVRFYAAQSMKPAGKSPKQVSAILEAMVALREPRDSDHNSFMAQIFTPASARSLPNVFREYRLGSPAVEVRRLLNQHPFLGSVLRQARIAIDTHFGPDTIVRLEVVYDPDGDARGRLFGYIVTDLSVEEAIELRERFVDEYWLDAMPEARSLLNFDVSWT